MYVRQFVDEGLGNSAHLVISKRAGVAALVDPLRDVDRYIETADAEGVRITHVFETHIHNDFITGSRELAARTNATVCASAAAHLEFDHHPLSDGDEVMVGDVRFTVLATPGHTPEHVSYLAQDVSGRDMLEETLPSAGQPSILFSGGSLLVGAVSRTDLLGHEHATGLAHQLYHSIHDKILTLPDDVVVYPTHGVGSFCTAAPGADRRTTIGLERRTNPLLQLPNVDAFAAEVLQSMPSYPTYFRYMRDINKQGPRILGGLPTLSPLSPAEVQDRMGRGEAVVDIRPVERYVHGHIPGVYHIELRPAFASWVGWVVPFGTPVILVSDGEGSNGSAEKAPGEDVGEGTRIESGRHEEAVRQLVHIGYDRLPGYLDGGMVAWERAGLPIRRMDVLTVRELRERLARSARGVNEEPLVVLDVRQDAEWTEGHIGGALHIEGGVLAESGLTLPLTQPLAAHCGHWQRAATGLSVLERLGYQDLRLVEGGFDAWREAGLPVERGAGRGTTGGHTASDLPLGEPRR